MANDVMLWRMQKTIYKQQQNRGVALKLKEMGVVKMYSVCVYVHASMFTI